MPPRRGILYGQLNPKELADLGYTAMPLEKELAGLKAVFPFMEPYIKSAADGLMYCTYRLCIIVS